MRPPRKKPPAAPPPAPPPAAGAGAAPIAVIDIGSTAVRMTVAQIRPDGQVEVLDSLQQPVSLGKDTFTLGYIGRSSIEACVAALKGFRKVLQEYQVTRPDQIAAVATTAVREAENRETFLDRVHVATGIRVEPLEDTHLALLTYLGIQRCLRMDRSLARGRVLVTEVSGGATELLLLQNGDVALSETHRLGALRMHELSETHRTPAARQREFMESSIRRTVNQVLQVVSAGGPIQMLALGGDIRFAAAQILPAWKTERFARLRLSALSDLTEKLLSMAPDRVARKFRIPLPDAETAGPALLVYTLMARSLGLKEIVVTDTTMRHGLLLEMAGGGLWSASFRRQILRSAEQLARKFRADMGHARHVADLAHVLFDALQTEHQLGPRQEILLRAAALLHDIGRFVGGRSHHRHSMYLIQNSQLFGLSGAELTLLGLIARYHRRSPPRPTQPEYTALSRDDRVLVCKLASLLRVADALDRANARRIRRIRCLCEEGRFVIAAPGVDDVALEQLALREKGNMFEEVYGLQVVLRPETMPAA